MVVVCGDELLVRVSGSSDFPPVVQRAKAPKGRRLTVDRCALLRVGLTQTSMAFSPSTLPFFLLGPRASSSSAPSAATYRTFPGSISVQFLDPNFV